MVILGQDIRPNTLLHTDITLGTFMSPSDQYLSSPQKDGRPDSHLLCAPCSYLAFCQVGVKCYRIGRRAFYTGAHDYMKGKTG